MSFIEKHRPRHKILDAMNALREETPSGVLGATKNFGVAVATADTTKTRVTSLFDIYKADIRVIYTDMMSRPEHYTEEQKTTMQQLLGGKDVSDADKNSVFMAWQRPTEFETKTKDLLKELSDRRHREAKEDAEITLEDGKSLAEHKDEEASFEKQDHGDRIII